jgi:hypothetical protein
MAAKRPTGELPKRNSSLAKFIAGNTAVNKLNPAQSRVAAGKYRDNVKKTGAKTMDQTGVQLGKAIKQAQSLGPVNPKARPKDDKLVQAITNQYRVTAKEAAKIVETVKQMKPQLGNVNPAKEAAKFVGGAVKANVQLPGKVAKIAKRNAAGVVKNFKQGYNK